jgi:RloB-like protein
VSAPPWRSGRLRRQRLRLPPRERILIVCEGRETEPRYFDAWRREARSPLVNIEIVPLGADPKRVVECAVERMADAARAARKDPHAGYDEVWCVFDREQHERYDEALHQARANGIRLATSNPCFEFWVLLHFEDRRGHIEASEAKRASRSHIPEYEKVVPFDKVRPLYDEACARARELDRWQRSQGCAGRNPTTLVYLLTEKILSLAREAQLKLHSRGR